MSYNKAEAIRLYNAAKESGLSGHELLKDTEMVMRECNGIGADWMTDTMRHLCTKLNSVMELPAAIHDIRYAKGTTRADRQEADLEFLGNCIKVINETYAWYNPMRYIMSRRAVRFFSYLQMFGSVAFNNGKGEAK